MAPRAVVARSLGLALLSVAAAACGAGALPPVSAPPAVSPSPVITNMPASPAAATPTPEPAGPPEATLRGVSGGGAPGDLGSFSWDGLSSDAPWIVGRAAGKARTGGRLSVDFVPAAGQAMWQARWAPVSGNQAGTPADGGSGAGGTIELIPPGTAGTWSLQLSATFGSGRSATWYWRVEVAP